MSYLTSSIFKSEFSEMSLGTHLETLLPKLNIMMPTPVQAQSIPVCLEGADAIIVAQTGSGKTLAYALPIVAKLLLAPEARALILVPSREVADQIFKVFQKLLGGTEMKSALIISGTPHKEQVSLLKKKPRVIVATPGRLNDHLTENKLLLQGTSMLVIDEADRMLDMGFAPQLKEIRKTMRGSWSTWMFSASFGAKVEAVAKNFMGENVYLIKPELSEKPVEQLSQKVIFLNRGMKNDRLAEELKESEGQVIVFAGNKFSCESVGNHLRENGFSSDFIHGELSPGHRNRVLREFREGQIQIMITTDLLARGLDVPNIACVVNYDLPGEPEDFLHRIGRTARAGQKGKALTFVTPGDQAFYQKIEKFLVGAQEERLN